MLAGKSVDERQARGAGCMPLGTGSQSGRVQFESGRAALPAHLLQLAAYRPTPVLASCHRLRGQLDVVVGLRVVFAHRGFPSGQWVCTQVL